MPTLRGIDLEASGQVMMSMEPTGQVDLGKGSRDSGESTPKTPGRIEQIYVKSKYRCLSEFFSHGSDMIEGD